MGASNSTPQNVEFVNKTPIQEITITEDVLMRLQQAKKHELAKSTESGGGVAARTSPPRKATTEATTTPTKELAPQDTTSEAIPPKTPVVMPTLSLAVPSYEPVQRQDYAPLKEQQTKLKPSDVEEMHYKKTVKQLDTQLGKPVYWSQEYKPELESFQSEIKSCYKTYPMEPLRCSEIAKEYQQFVFDKQQETVKKIGEGNAKPTSNEQDKEK